MSKSRSVTGWRQWLDDLDALAEATYGMKATDMCAPKEWRSYWQDGYLPSEALTESHEDR